MEIDGLPLHPLVVHLVIALVPLAALSACVLALVPGWRWVTRWTTPLLGAGAVVAVLVARASGSDLLAARFAEVPELLETHQDRADVLLWIVVALTAVAVVAVFVLPAPTPLRSGRLGSRGAGGPWGGRLAAAALLATGVLALVWVYLTGDAGARSVWEGAMVAASLSTAPPGC